MSAYRPEKVILSLGDSFYDAVKTADFPQAILRFQNDRAADEIGLAHLSSTDWVRHFGRFEPLPRSLPEPLALRYHGHQFRTYNPDIGDGRGFLFAQLRDGEGRLLDLGTKGSGQTPYSRFGDGRLTLKGGVREILATEMLEALGVETSRTFSLVETGEALDRGDEPSPTRSAVLVRLSHSHVRIGTFQRLAYFQDADAMRRLIDYCLNHFVDRHSDAAVQPGVDGETGLLRSARNDEAVARFFDYVAKGCARLAASYIAAGFVHGVLNTDNINITAESFDYGPWRFTPYWDGHFTAAYFDHAGLYSFGRQPEAIHWNLAQLAASLRLIVDADMLAPSIEAFPDLFRRELAAAMLSRLGVKPKDEESDARLLIAIETVLVEKSVMIDRFFFDWRGGHRQLKGTDQQRPDELGKARNPPLPYKESAPYKGEKWDGLRVVLEGYEPADDLSHPYWTDAEPCSMHIEEVEAIWAAIDDCDDWAPLYAKVAAIRRMGEAMLNA